MWSSNRRRLLADQRDFRKWAKPELPPRRKSFILDGDCKVARLDGSDASGNMPTETVLNLVDPFQLQIRDPEVESVCLSRKDRSPEGYISSLELQGLGENRSITFDKHCVDHLRIYSVVSGRAMFNNCWIKTVEFGFNSQPTSRSFRGRAEFRECHIETLKLPTKSISHLNFECCTIGQIIAPSSHEESPFNGSISILDCILPEYHPELDPSALQGLRNLRHHLAALHNLPMASLIHAAELRLERRNQDHVTRAISWMYEALSKFGYSTARPMFSLGMALIGFAAIYAGLDGVTTVPPPKDQALVGYRANLSCDGWGGRFDCGILFSLNSMLNPFGIFSTSSPLIARSTLFLIVQMFQGLFSIVCLALLIVALQRRFRLSQSSAGN